MAKVLLQLNNLYKRYGAQVILDDASASFLENQKIGVIGRNGAGKSTMCKIIIGQEEADGGTVAQSQDLRLAYLEQHDPYKLDETILGFLMRYTGKEEWQCGKMAARFQMKGEFLETKIGALSGGYRTRVKLTAMLLAEPNFLILDEPTNYLDLKTLILLEDFLQEYEGAFLIVSHDREFLKKTCEHTLEVEQGQMTLYPGSVDDYLVFKEEQKEQALSTNRNIEAKKKQLQDFVTRFGAKASKASQAKSKMKQIEKLNTKTIDVGHALSNVHIRIPQVDKRNGIAFRCENLAIGYPEKVIAKDINVEVNQGAHVAILGDNGQGKTTFMRTLAEDLQAKSGTFRWGHGMKIAYYAQHVFASLHPGQDVYTNLSEKAAPGVTRQEILNLAGSFLFKGDDVKKMVGVLSGGERARVLLAGLLLSKSNVILLDEPTNHLDFETVEALGHALKNFNGTVFFISHDRTFVNLLASEIIEVGGGKVVRYPGNYEEYVYSLSSRLHKELHPEEDAPVPAAVAKVTVDAKTYYTQKKELESERRKLATRVKRLEEGLEAYKAEKDGIEKEFLADAGAWTMEKNHRLEELTRLIAADEKTWLEAVEKTEAVQARLAALTGKSE